MVVVDNVVDNSDVVVISDVVVVFVVVVDPNVDFVV